MGPEATLDFFNEIIRATPATRDQEHLRVIIDNNPKIADRTQAIMGKGADPVPEMVKSGLSLERAGADFIVIPCISAHYFLDNLQRQLRLPVLSVLDQVLFLITQEHPNIYKTGLMATLGTIKGGFFQKKPNTQTIQNQKNHVFSNHEDHEG